MPHWPWQQFAENRRLQRLSRQPRGAILCYHRVFQTETDPMLLCVSPRRFEQQLIYLKKNYRPLSLSQLVSDRQENQLADRSIALTFDDGYTDNLLHALPLLEKYQVPATVFVCSGQIDSPHEYWWDELERILLGDISQHWPQSIQVPIKHLKRTWQIRCDQDEQPNPQEKNWDVTQPFTPSLRHLAYREIHAILLACNHTQQSHAIASICRQLHTPTAGRPQNLAMRAEQLVQLAKSPYIQIGAHTINHPQLSALSDQDQTHEIQQSQADIQNIIKQEVSSFSYPYGGSLDYTPMTTQIIRDLGFKYACANIPGIITAAQKPVPIDPFQLPRFLVRNWDQETFAQHLSQMFMTPSRVAA